MEITYDYEKTIEYNGDKSGVLVETLTSATLHDDNTTQVEKRDGGGILSIALAMLFGAVATLALVAIVVGDKKRKRMVMGQRKIDASEIVKEADMTNDVDKTVQLKHVDVGIC